MQADCKLAGVPSELLPFASDLHRATGHLPRRDRVQALAALTSSYHHLRKQAAAMRAPGARQEATLGALVEQMVSVGTLLGQSDVDGAAVAAALLCPCAVAGGGAGGWLDAAAVEAEFGGEVAAILKGFQAMLAVEQQVEIKALMTEYSKYLWCVLVLFICLSPSPCLEVGPDMHTLTASNRPNRPHLQPDQPTNQPTKQGQPGRQPPQPAAGGGQGLARRGAARGVEEGGARVGALPEQEGGDW